MQIQLDALVIGNVIMLTWPHVMSSLECYEVYLESLAWIQALGWVQYRTFWVWPFDLAIEPSLSRGWYWTWNLKK